MKQLFVWGVLLAVMQIPPSIYAAPIKVITTTEDLAAITREIGGDRVRVDFIAKGVQDPHFIEAKPSYMLKLSRAKLFVQVGLGLEGEWVPPLLTGARNIKLLRGGNGHVDASEGVALLEIPKGRLDRSAGDAHGQGNPHYWLDPLNGKQIAQNIGEGLKRVDPKGKAQYDHNIIRFSERLDSAMKRWSEALKPFKGEKVITYHNSWPYFLQRFGLTAVGYVEPKPGIPPSSSHLIQLIQRIKEEKVKIIIVEPYFGAKTPQFVARKSGAKVIGLPPSVSKATGVTDYFQLFDHIVATLTTALE
ncbi:MAG: metal ABC transporter substrate-binding protein [Nitrospiria bacterium]